MGRWSRARGVSPGIRRRCNRFAARLSVGGRWVHLGLFRSEWIASRVAELARALKAASSLSGCKTTDCIRRVVAREAMKLRALADEIPEGFLTA